MTKTELIKAVSEAAEVSKKDTEIVVNQLLETIMSEMAIGEKIIITGFGTFEVRERSARQGVNPKTGEKIKIAASKVPSFKAGALLKEAVNKA